MDEFFFPSHSWTNTFVKYTKNGLLEERNKKNKQANDLQFNLLFDSVDL